MTCCKFELPTLLVLLAIGVCNSVYVRQGNTPNTSYPDSVPPPPSVPGVPHAVVPETYLFRGNFVPLFTGTPFPISILVTHTSLTSVTISLEAFNSIEFEVSYNNVSGVVNEVVPVTATSRRGTPDQMDAEAKVKNIIGSIQQIAFEKDGTIQLITDGGTTRISFTPGASDSFPGLAADEVVDIVYNEENPVVEGLGQAGENTEIRLVIAESYYENGRLQPLFTGSPFRVSLHTMGVHGKTQTVVLQAVNTAVYEFSYSSADGKVQSVRLISATDMTGTPEQMATENKIKNLIAHCQQASLDKDGTLLIKYGNASIRFSAPEIDSPKRNLLATTSALQEGQTLLVAPESYLVFGKSQPLFNGPPYEISIHMANQDEESLLAFRFKAINSVAYSLAFDDTDGSVREVKLLSATEKTGTSEQMATESRVRNVIEGCKKIVFEADGGIQFSIDAFSTSISFQPPSA